MAPRKPGDSSSEGRARDPEQGSRTAEVAVNDRITELVKVQWCSCAQSTESVERIQPIFKEKKKSNAREQLMMMRHLHPPQFDCRGQRWPPSQLPCACHDQSVDRKRVRWLRNTHNLFSYTHKFMHTYHHNKPSYTHIYHNMYTDTTTYIMDPTAFGRAEKRGKKPLTGKYLAAWPRGHVGRAVPAPLPLAFHLLNSDIGPHRAHTHTEREREDKHIQRSIPRPTTAQRPALRQQ